MGRRDLVARELEMMLQDLKAGVTDTHAGIWPVAAFQLGHSLP